ncbi:MAG: hypothetical protein IJX52_07845 [Oscillibacter sp.]|nr:hypothetical protein [Oscillibacter sp.]
MHQKSMNNRLAFYVLVVAIVVGIVSLIAVRPAAPETFGEFFPPVEEIEYLNISAEGERPGSAVTREGADFAALKDLAAQIPMQGEQKSYVGKKYEGTLYHLVMGYSGNEYDFYVATDGSVFHANGQYFLTEGEETEALYAWLTEFCQ